MPYQAVSVVSNLNYWLSSDPTNRQQLASFILNLSTLGTNVIGEMESFKPVLGLDVNGTTISNFDQAASLANPSVRQAVNLTNGELNLIVRNKGSITASHVTANIFIPVDATNIIAEYWKPEPPDQSQDNYVKFENGTPVFVTRPCSRWTFVAEGSVGGAKNEGVLFPPFGIKDTNWLSLPVGVLVHADLSDLKEFHVCVVNPNLKFGK
jgi:hypothetical protein